MLKENGVAISQRLGARLVALARRGVRFSLAVLEEAAPQSPLEAVLLQPRWTVAEGTPDAVRGWLADFPHLTVQAESDTVHVLTPDEVDTQAAPQASLLPVVMGPQASRGVGGTLFDRPRLEEAALVFLDAEDGTRIVESFRYLFRAALSSGQDAVPLLVSAFRRGKRQLSLEAAALVKAHLSRDTGRALEDLLSDRPARIREGLHALLNTRDDRWNPLLAVLLLPVLTELLGTPEHLHLVLSVLPRLTTMRWEDAPLMEAFLDRLLAEAIAYDSPERFAIGTFLVELRPVWPSLVDFVTGRLTSTRDLNLRAFYGSVLSRLKLPDAVRETCIEWMVEAFLEGGHDTGFQERLRNTLLKFAPQTLERLAEQGSWARLKPIMRPYLLSLWHQAETEGFPMPEEGVMARFAAHELQLRHRPSLLEMVRSGKLLRDSIVDTVRHDPVLRMAVTGYLQEEVSSLEEGEDEPAYRFLARLGFEPAESFYQKLREEGALDAQSAPWRARALARTLTAMQAQGLLDAARTARAAEMVVDTVRFEFIRQPRLPVTLQAMGLLAALPDVPADAVADYVGLLFGDLAIWPDARMQAVVCVHRSSFVPESVRHSIEDRLFGLLSDDATPRPQLRAALAATSAMLEGPHLPQSVGRLSAILARAILKRQHETSLQAVLKDALRPDGDDTGVRVPTAWDKADRDTAMRILGQVARHEEAPPGLSRQLTARLISFLDDWLDYQVRGRDLYLQRDTPLWEILTTLLDDSQTDPIVLEALDGVAIRLLEAHGRAPGYLALERREDAQRFLLEYLKRERHQVVVLRGVTLDVEHAVVELLLQLGAEDETCTLSLLRELVGHPGLPPSLKAQVQRFLDGSVSSRSGG